MVLFFGLVFRCPPLEIFLPTPFPLTEDAYIVFFLSNSTSDALLLCIRFMPHTYALHFMLYNIIALFV